LRDLLPANWFLRQAGSLAQTAVAWELMGRELCSRRIPGVPAPEGPAIAAMVNAGAPSLARGGQIEAR
jgi:hypothetical protein